MIPQECDVHAQKQLLAALYSLWLVRNLHTCHWLQERSGRVGQPAPTYHTPSTANTIALFLKHLIDSTVFKM